MKLKLLKLIFGFLIIFISGCQSGSSVNKEEAKSNEASPETLLLKNWKPKSIFKIPITDIQKCKFPAIDMHAHNFTMTAEDVEKRYNGLNEVGVGQSVVFAGTGKKFDSSYALYSKYPDKFKVFCGLDFKGYEASGWSDKAVAELRRCVAMGALGVGEISDKGQGLAPGMHPDDPRMDAVWEECAKLGISVNLHMSDPMWMYEPMDSSNDGLMRSYTWRIKDNDRVKSHGELMKILDNTLTRHPNTIFVAAHMANCIYNLDILDTLLNNHPNLYFDISARFAEFSTIPRQAAHFFEKHQDQIVYGTDYGWEVWNKNTDYGNNTTFQEMYRMTFRVLETADEHFYLTDLVGYKWPMYGLQLNDVILEKIYNGNAKRIFKLKTQ